MPADVPAEMALELLKTAFYPARAAPCQRGVKKLQDREKQIFFFFFEVKGRVAVPELGVQGSSLNQQW